MKDGHLDLGFDCALDALRYTPIDPVELQTLVSKGALFGATNRPIFSPFANPYFRADYLTGLASQVDAGFAILLVLGDAGTVTFDAHDPITVTKGDALVIPFAAGSWELIGTSGIVSRPPLSEFAALAI